MCTRALPNLRNYTKLDPFPTVDLGYEAAVLVQAANDTVLDSAFTWNRPACLASGAAKALFGSGWNSNANLEDAHDERFGRPVVAQ